jgi:hypothetical protein
MKSLPKLLFLALLTVSVPAQISHGSNKRSPHRRAVTLETILSCSDDSLMAEVFKTDARTAYLDLSVLLMVAREQQKSGPSDIARAKGFLTGNLSESKLIIFPTDYLGHTIEAAKRPFCRDGPTADYKNLMDTTSGPYMVEIDGEDWSLDNNEVFAHADQFQFRSGVYKNSSEVFFEATKERVSIQFVCRPNGLKFYRALYGPRD